MSEVRRRDTLAFPTVQGSCLSKKEEETSAYTSSRNPVSRESQRITNDDEKRAKPKAQGPEAP
jgi:hypothetical protein